MPRRPRRAAGAARARARTPLTGAARRRRPEATATCSRAPRPSCSRRLSRAQPLLLVADDLHWADGETLHLLRRLARIAPEARLLVVAAYRDRGEEIAAGARRRRSPTSRASTACTRLSLGRLSDEEWPRSSAPRRDAERAAGARRRRSASSPAARRSCSASSGATCARAARVEVSDAQRAARRGRSPSCAAPSASATSCGSASRALLRRRPRRSSSRPSPGRGSSCACSPRRPGSTDGALARARSTRRSGHGLARGAARAGARLPLHARARAPRRLRPHRRRPPRRAPPPRRRGARAGPRGRSGAASCPSSPTTSRSPPRSRGVERAVDYNLRAGEAAIAGGRARRGRREARDRARARHRRPARARARPGRARATSSASWGASRSPTRCSPRASTPRPVSEERGVAARALVGRIGHAAWAIRSLDGERCGEVAEAAIETFAELGDLAASPRRRGRSAIAFQRQGRRGRVAAPSSSGRSCDAEASGDAGHAPAGGRQRCAFALCVGPTPVADAIRRCEELLRAAASDHVLEAVVERCLVGAAARWRAASTRRSSSSERSSLVLDELDQSRVSWVLPLAPPRTQGADRRPSPAPSRSCWRGGRRFRELRTTRSTQRAMNAAYRLALLYCDDGRWDDAERLPRLRPRRSPCPTTSPAGRLAASPPGARVAAHAGGLDEGARARSARRRARRAHRHA